MLVLLLAVVMAGPVPCDPRATPEVHAVLELLAGTLHSGKIISGQVEADEHDDAVGGSKTFTDRDWNTVHNLTGKHPGIWGSQFLWGPDTWAAPYRQAMIDRAVELWNHADGRVISQINFHLCPPTTQFHSRACHWSDIEGQGHNKPSLGDAMLKNGTAENVIWIAQLDTMAAFLLQLQAKGVPVLWRPYHEANGAWFWWGRQPRFVELWAQMFSRFCDHHGLHNLVWVYGPSGQFPMSPQFPGAQYVDVLGQDTYANSQSGFTKKDYEDLVATADGKPIAWTEIGLAPGESVLSSQNHSYFLMWGGYETSHNSKAEINAIYHSPRTLNQGDLWP